MAKAGGSMRRIALIAAAMCAVSVSVAASAQVHVRGHFRKDGTYVPPHVRSAPNSSRMDNWSTRPNINPYTGRAGEVDPLRIPSIPRYQPRVQPQPRYNYRPQQTYPTNPFSIYAPPEPLDD